MDSVQSPHAVMTNSSPETPNASHSPSALYLPLLPRTNRWAQNRTRAAAYQSTWDSYRRHSSTRVSEGGSLDRMRPFVIPVTRQTSATQAKVHVGNRRTTSCFVPNNIEHLALLRASGSRPAFIRASGVSQAPP